MDDGIQALKTKLDEAKQYLKEELSSIRGSRPTPALVEDIAVEYFEQKVPVKQLGSISVIPPREIQVQVWDQNAAKAVENAIAQKLGIQTALDGMIIHCNLPELTLERKQELAKVIKQKAEESRIRSRTIRDDVKKEIDKKEESGEIAKDEKFDTMEKVQKEMDAFNKSVEDTVTAKLSEIGV